MRPPRHAVPAQPTAADDGEPGKGCLQRFVSGLGRLVPAGEQLEYKPLEIEMPPPAPRAGSAAARQQQQEELERPLHGRSSRYSLLRERAA